MTSPDWSLWVFTFAGFGLAALHSLVAVSLWSFAVVLDAWIVWKAGK